MTNSLKIALAQINPTLGDIDGNVEKIAAAVREVPGADLVIFSELSVIGYPPEDLVRKPAFVAAAYEALQQLATLTVGGPALLVGAPIAEGEKVYNAAVLLDQGEIAAVRYKHLLPNYGPFDEKRVFDSGKLPQTMEFRGVQLGVMVCEDMWTPRVTQALEHHGAEILVVLNGSPFDNLKLDSRMGHAAARIEETGLPLIYVNQVGGQDELVFDGASFIANGDQTQPVQFSSWKVETLLTEWAKGDDGWACVSDSFVPPRSYEENLYQAMVLGLRDYVNKNGFPGVIIGMSGGIDSALSAAIAVDALGADRVRLVMMPSKYTSQESLDDAAKGAEVLGCRIDTVSIAPAVDAFDGMLSDLFAGAAANEAEENIQARARGMTLMALSNKFGHMVLTTGNKSEMSVGYATLYGDMCGGYSVLKDLYKVTVYKLSQWRNEHLPADVFGPAAEVVPENIIVKAPTAELRPNQTDQDSLPPYEVLDAILHMLIEEEKSFDEIVGEGFDPALVRRIEHLLYIAEYKRRQAPPGVKLTQRSFGRDRRYPITNRFRNAP